VSERKLPDSFGADLNGEERPVRLHHLRWRNWQAANEMRPGLRRPAYRAPTPTLSRSWTHAI